MPLAATYRRVDMKALARFQIILLGEQRHIGVNNLPNVVARQCSGRELNPRPPDHESDTLATTPPSHQCLLTPSHAKRSPFNLPFVTNPSFSLSTSVMDWQQKYYVNGFAACSRCSTATRSSRTLSCRPTVNRGSTKDCWNEWQTRLSTVDGCTAPGTNHHNIIGLYQGVYNSWKSWKSPGI